MISIGIVGLPNVGKSTLFNALTNSNILAANYPFATIEPNTGVVAVPDERLEILRSLYHSDKIIPASVTFIDIAGLVAGASDGEGLGNKFLANIRECQAIVHVVRSFTDSEVIRHDQSLTATPNSDIETINTELCLADLQTIDKHLAKLEKDAKANPKLRADIDYIKSLKPPLLAGKLLSSLPDTRHDLIRDLHLLTIKPTIYAFNISEMDLADTPKLLALQQLVAPAKSIFICAKLEAELNELDPSERRELLESYGIKQAGLANLIQSAYDILGLQSYLTAGPKEVRAWTIQKGATAPEAAGVIHTDFEKGFIAAQIISYPDLIAAGSEAAVKAAGKIRTEGKAYVMQPDDIVEFRFNVSK